MRQLLPPSSLAALLALPVVIALAVPPPAPAAAEASPAAGKQAFVDLKCSMCHSIDSQGIERKTKSDKVKGPDLSDIGSARDAAWLVRWLHNEEKAADGKTHNKEFKGTPEQLQALTAWLASMRKG